MTPERRAQFHHDLTTISAEIERINAMIVKREEKRSRMYRFGMIGLAAAIVAALAYVPFAQGQTPTSEQLFNTQSVPVICTNHAQMIELIDKDRRMMKPIYVQGDLAKKLTGLVAQLAPSDQAIIVAAADGRMVILACGPGNNWQPRHFMIDVESERKFYNLAPEIPQEELPKRKRTRKAQP
jgi:hypothetical protein